MRTTIILFLAINTAIAGVIDNALKQVELQLSFLVENTDEARAQSTSPKQIMPRSLKSDGSIKMVNQDDWCSGFYPGTLWQMYRITKADRWRREAARNTALLEQVQHHSGSHDIGFMICCSFGNGFTMSYRYTHNRKFLKKAQHVADFFFNQKDLPEDFIPYWDMKDPNIAIQPTLVPRDASAAAIMASALYELAEYSSRKVARRYRGYADKILASLCTKYLNEPGTQHGFLLSHSTGNWPANDEIDIPLNYADYYFLEAISRNKNSHP